MVNLAVSSSSLHHLAEISQRLPLILQLCPIMPRLKAAHFLLGDSSVRFPAWPILTVAVILASCQQITRSDTAWVASFLVPPVLGKLC